MAIDQPTTVAPRVGSGAWRFRTHRLYPGIRAAFAANKSATEFTTRAISTRRLRAQKYAPGAGDSRRARPLSGGGYPHSHIPFREIREWNRIGSGAQISG